MHAALDKVGVENRLKMFPGADHDFYVKGDPAKTDAYATDAMNGDGRLVRKPPGEVTGPKI